MGFPCRQIVICLLLPELIHAQEGDHDMEGLTAQQRERVQDQMRKFADHLQNDMRRGQERGEQKFGSDTWISRKIEEGFISPQRRPPHGVSLGNAAHVVAVFRAKAKIKAGGFLYLTLYHEHSEMKFHTTYRRKKSESDDDKDEI
mmetsp:Transcript_46757/g.77424  ORF Transcript_46757/g.77424 Transcript_46757/m.77424 type:complete len:145 (-) Transcript_46757:133-567(-)|eukprot:CAMPEP_0119335734 /NCGR_PEP_ID=MMETSP1333-20130426/90197_1 /TAXON_ID=418940 /ORGANISM="Scyphosphaera apsteinii, Strain RCC1455" /LENGTH=144 /DNA_ID=CAMNT_0007346367 /DNA_START=122 /DNA_END=556 /DNA_ORIENTATION=+